MTAFLLTLLISVNAGIAEAKVKKNVPQKTRTAVMEGLCSFEVPAAWDIEQKPYAKQTGVQGLKVSPRNSTPEAPVMLYADYYSQDDKVFASTESYVARLVAPGTLRPVGRKAGKPQSARLGTLAATSVEIENIDLYPPEALEPKKIPVKERVVVAGAQKGFFVLRCYAGKALYPKIAMVCETALRTFKQLPAASK